MAVPQYRDGTLLRRFLRLARPVRWQLLVFGIVSLLGAPLAVVTPLPLKIAVDSGIGSQPLAPWLGALAAPGGQPTRFGILFLAAGMLVAIALLTQCQNLGVTLLQTYAGERLLLEFRSRLFRHMQRLSLVFHDTVGSADSLYRVQYDAMAVQALTVDHVIPFVTSAITVAGMLYVTLRISLPLGLIAVVVAPVIYLGGRHFRQGLRSGWRDANDLDKSALAVVSEVLQGIRVVKAFAREEDEEERFVRRSTAGMRARVRLGVLQGKYGLVVGLLTASGTAAVLLVGARQVQEGVLTLGNLLVVMGYLAQLYQPLKSMAKRSANLQSQLAHAERAFALLDEAPEVFQKPHARRLARASGSFVFQDVSFGYRAERPVLEGFTLRVPAGTRLGIAGKTGAGKTTLAGLLLRFYDPTSGAIYLDGVDLRDYVLGDLRSQFAFVPQDPVLFSTSIAENISYGRPEANEEEIVAAAAAAHAHEFITRLPEGYRTLVGERGMCLSGGERQRISLARAFLKNAPILILDEPTSSVDLKTESLMVEAMNRLMEGRTTFLISHRVHVFSACDLVLQLERGRLVKTIPAEAALVGARSEAGRTLT